MDIEHSSFWMYEFERRLALAQNEFRNNEPDRAIAMLEGLKTNLSAFIESLKVM